MVDYTNDKDNSSNEQVDHLDQSNYVISGKDVILKSSIGQGEEHLDKGVVNKLIRKADLRLMPALSLLYAFSLIGRVSLSVVCHHLDQNVICRLFADNRQRPGSQAWTSSWDYPSATDILLLQ